MFIVPVPGPVTRGFHYKSNIYVGGQHAAIDIAAPSGTPIRAVAAGFVRGVGWDQLSGFFVAITHDSGWRSTYRHLYGQSPVVVGQSVTQGQIIGNVGNTGYSLGPHLHFDLWCPMKHDSTAFAKHGLWAHDPVLYLGQEDDDMALTAEQWKLIQDIHHHDHVLLPQILAGFENREKARYDQLRKDIAASGGGVSIKGVLAEIVRRLKP